MGLCSEKNYVVANAVENILAGILYIILKEKSQRM